MRSRHSAMTDFSSKHVIVTGGSSGIGLATAKLFRNAGASVSLIARDPAKLSAAASEMGARHAACDVSLKESVFRAFEELCAAQGPCDVLVSSAGIAYPGYFELLNDTVFRQMIEVDYFGTLYPVQAVVPSMMARRSGSIVAISSTAGILGIFGYTAYSPAKFAVRGLMDSLRQEMHPYGIHVGVVYPPDTNTPMLAYENEFKPLETHRVAGTIPPVSAERVARAILSGVAKRRRVITADPLTATLYRIGGLLEPLLLRDFHSKIRKARRERGLQ